MTKRYVYKNDHSSMTSMYRWMNPGSLCAYAIMCPAKSGKDFSASSPWG
jgi:hypothetical protein